MDAKVQQIRQNEIKIDDDGGFAFLFAQLDHPEAVAPIDQGLQRLMTKIALLRRSRPAG